MYLYIITDGEFQKIGIAGNPHSRLKELQTGNPRKLSVLKMFEHEDAQRLEVAFHHLMDSGRQQGEWFRMTEKELRGISLVFDCFGINCTSTIQGASSHANVVRTTESSAGAQGVCKHCGSTFIKTRSNHDFCCAEHKAHYWKLAKRKGYRGTSKCQDVL
jgi:hypothetical protein